MGLNFSAFVGSFQYVIEGWLGIFIVMGIIIYSIKLLNKVADKIDEKVGKKDA